MPFKLFANVLKNGDSRAHRWTQLALMLDAGMQPTVAVKTLNKTKHQDNTALARMAQLLERGRSFTSTFKQLGLLSEYELAMLSSAEQAGRVAQGLQHIASDAQQRVEQANILAVGFILPKAILIIGALAAVFIRVFQFGQDAVVATIRVSLMTFLALGATQLFLYLWSKDVRGNLSLLWPSKFIRQNSAWFQSNFEYNFYRSLNWQLQSGVPAGHALRACAAMLNNADFKKQLQHAVVRVEAGEAMPDVLAHQGLALSARMKQTLAVANQTGVFEKSIARELSLLKQRMNLRIEQQIKWLPKIYYFLVLWFVVTQLF